MNPSQKVIKMSTVSLDETAREMATPLTDGRNNSRMVQLYVFNLQSLFQFCKTSLLCLRAGKGITLASFEMQLQFCPEWTQE